MIYYRYPLYRYPPIANQNLQKQTNTPTRQEFQKDTRTQFQYEINSKMNRQTHSEIDSKRISEKNDITNKTDENILLEIFGIKLHFDDVLLICLIFFLYNEGVQDQYLFIVLILLLLS